MSSLASRKKTVPAPSERWLSEILIILFRQRSTTRSKLMELTGLDMACVSNSVQYLIERNLVVIDGHLPSTGGRKSELLRINPKAGYFVVIDLEGSPIRFGLADLAGGFVERFEQPVAAHDKLSVRTMLKGIRTILKAIPDAGAPILGPITVSCPGLIDSEGRVTAVNLGWEQFPLARKLEEAAGMPVVIESRKFIQMMAERCFGVARDATNCVHVTITNGIGMSVIANHELLRGSGAFAGEFGHIVIDPGATDLCMCGRRGCLESIISSPQIVRQYLERTGRSMAAYGGHCVRDVFDLARNGDPAANRVVQRAATHLGLGLSFLANVLNPELIVLGGDVAHARDLFLPVVERSLKQWVLPALLNNLRVEISSLGPEVGLVGASVAAFERSVQDPSRLLALCAGNSMV